MDQIIDQTRDWIMNQMMDQIVDRIAWVDRIVGSNKSQIKDK